MSLYHETAEFLTAPANAGGSLKSRIFSKKDMKSQPAQIYAMAIESCKWSIVLKEVIENADILRLERKLTPILSVLLVHDLLLAKRGIALPATHGLRTSVERHKGRLQSEFTKARLRRKLSSVEALKAYIETGVENSADTSEAPYPRWIRINTLKTTLEDQLITTFANCKRVLNVKEVRQRGSQRIFIDNNIPNLVAISPSIDLSKSEAYKAGAVIFQDKASCFPAYLLDPSPEDGDIIDTCSAPGNKTTHIAAILHSQYTNPQECGKQIFAYEKNKGRADTLQKMVNLAGSGSFTKVHPGHDFLRTDPDSSTFKTVTALLLDPSCSGSGIVGRDDMPELHLPIMKQGQGPGSSKNHRKGKVSNAKELDKDPRKRKHEEIEGQLDVMIDDDGMVTAVDTEDELKARLAALSKFQLELLLHAFRFPAARKITYSTCSIHVEENEDVVKQALDSAIAKERGWRILKRGDQVKGMKDWPVRGLFAPFKEDTEMADACIRANKGDEHGTMGFFVAGFVRKSDYGESTDKTTEMNTGPQVTEYDAMEEEEEWAGFDDDDTPVTIQEITGRTCPQAIKEKPQLHQVNKHSHNAVMRRQDLGGSKKKKRRK